MRITNEYSAWPYCVNCPDQGFGEEGRQAIQDGTFLPESYERVSLSQERESVLPEVGKWIRADSLRKSLLRPQYRLPHPLLICKEKSS
jgi:hypothetical protein